MLLDLLVDATADEFEQLRAQVRERRCHRPAPGDADYQTPEQVARLKAEREDDERAIYSSRD